MWNARQIIKAGQICDQMGWELVLSVDEGFGREETRSFRLAVTDLCKNCNEFTYRLIEVEECGGSVGFFGRVRCSRTCCQT